MTTRVVATIAAAILAVLMATPGFTCTTVCLLEQGRALVAYNYDFHPSEGLVLVNKRGTRKQSRVEPQGASWTARHGSITFNQFGRDNPTTGVNEQGLMVSLMWLDATAYPPPDHRPAVGILEWIQYHLDQHASVAEVVANAEAVRPTSRIPIHYLFADASGDAATIEFLDGTLVVHRGETLPVRALANSTYADSVAAFEAAKRTGEMPTSGSSLDRFVRGAMLASGDGDPMARSFAVLAAVARPGFTRWSIVYDLEAGDVYFKTDINEAIRRITVKAAQKLHQFLSFTPTAQRYGSLATTSWLFVIFGEHQVMAQLIAKRVLIFPLIHKDVPVHHPLLARGHLLP
jgi:penicillin V acylase-like amidase (Ntn superfamily)